VGDVFRRETIFQCRINSYLSTALSL